MEKRRMNYINGGYAFIDYAVANECVNDDALYICLKCGQCGRVFEDGIMKDDGGTTKKEFNDD